MLPIADGHDCWTHCMLSARDQFVESGVETTEPFWRHLAKYDAAMLNCSHTLLLPMFLTFMVAGWKRSEICHSLLRLHCKFKGHRVFQHVLWHRRLLHFHVFPALRPLLQQLVRIMQGKGPPVSEVRASLNTERLRLWFQQGSGFSLSGKLRFQCGAGRKLSNRPFLWRTFCAELAHNCFNWWNEVIVGCIPTTDQNWRWCWAATVSVLHCNMLQRRPGSLLQSGAYHPGGWIPSRADSVALCSWQRRACRGGRVSFTQLHTHANWTQMIYYWITIRESNDFWFSTKFDPFSSTWLVGAIGGLAL